MSFPAPPLSVIEGREPGRRCYLERRNGVSSNEPEDTQIYKVVINNEEQYSIWPQDRENAAGWNDVGKVGTKKECLAYIREVWTDMRPASLRKKLASSQDL